jgi:hypothetical protein
MAPLIPTNFRLDEELLEALQRVKDREGIPVTEQVRRAIRAWLIERGEKLPKAQTRKTKK